MRGLYGTVSYSDRAAIHSLHSKHFDAPHGADDIENGVHRADLMQVNTLDRCAVDRRLLLRDLRERGVRTLLHACWRRGSRHDLADLLQMAAMRLGRNRKIHFLARDVCANDV